MNKADGSGVKVVIMHGYTSSCQNERCQRLPFANCGVDVEHERYSWQQVGDIYEKLLEEARRGFEGRLIDGLKTLLP